MLGDLTLLRSIPRQYKRARRGRSDRCLRQIPCISALGRLEKDDSACQSKYEPKRRSDPLMTSRRLSRSGQKSIAIQPRNVTLDEDGDNDTLDEIFHRGPNLIRICTIRRDHREGWFLKARIDWYGNCLRHEARNSLVLTRDESNWVRYDSRTYGLGHRACHGEASNAEHEP
jgi:hypothetical protein